jgi:hypothetical protein
MSPASPTLRVSGAKLRECHGPSSRASCRCLSEHHVNTPRGCHENCRLRCFAARSYKRKNECQRGLSDSPHPRYPQANLLKGEPTRWVGGLQEVKTVSSDSLRL